MLSRYPFNSHKEVKAFTDIFASHLSAEVQIEKFIPIFKCLVFLNLMIDSIDNENQKRFINGIIYDALSAMIAISEKRERYLQLSVRSMIENTARISLSKDSEAGYKSENVSFREFEDLKKIDPNNWNGLYSQYKQSSGFVHSNLSAKLNINLTLCELLNQDNISSTPVQLALLTRTIKSITDVFLNCFYNEVSNRFYRNNEELRYLIGNNFEAFQHHLV